MPQPKPNRIATSEMMMRWTPEQRDRLGAAAKYAGVTMTVLIRDVVMKRVMEIEEEKRLRKVRDEEEGKGKAKPRFGLRAPESAKGMDLGARAKEIFAAEAEAAAASAATAGPAVAAAPTIIINNTPTAPAQTDKVDDYVAYVTKAGGDLFERQRREEHVAAIIQAGAPNPEEAQRIGKAFKDKLAEALTKNSAATNNAWAWLTGGKR